MKLTFRKTKEIIIDKIYDEELAEIHATRDTKEGHHDVMSNNAYKRHIQEEDT